MLAVVLFLMLSFATIIIILGIAGIFKWPIGGFWGSLLRLLIVLGNLIDGLASVPLCRQSYAALFLGFYTDRYRCRKAWFCIMSA